MNESNEAASIVHLSEWQEAEKGFQTLRHRLAVDIERRRRRWARGTADLALRGPFRSRLMAAGPGDLITLTDQEMRSCDDPTVVEMTELIDLMARVIAVLVGDEVEAEGTSD